MRCVMEKKIMNEHLDYFDKNRERICELADNQDKELEALLQTEVELADFQKVKVSLSEKVNMSALELMELEGFIEFTEQPQKEKDMETIIVAIITLVGTIGSGVLSAVISNNLIKYRVEQLEKKVDKHNNLIDRMYKAESNIKLIQEEVEQLEK